VGLSLAELNSSHDQLVTVFFLSQFDITSFRIQYC